MDVSFKYFYTRFFLLMDFVMAGVIQGRWLTATFTDLVLTGKAFLYNICTISRNAVHIKFTHGYWSKIDEGYVARSYLKRSILHWLKSCLVIYFFVLHFFELIGNATKTGKRSKILVIQIPDLVSMLWTLVKMLSINVAEVSVILVGLLING